MSLSSILLVVWLPRDILLLVCSIVFPVGASHVGECLAAMPMAAMAGVERPLVCLLLF